MQPYNFIISVVANSALIVCIYFGFEFYKSSQFSGYPYLNEDYRRRSAALRQATFFWVFGKIVKKFLKFI